MTSQSSKNIAIYVFTALLALMPLIGVLSPRGLGTLPIVMGVLGFAALWGVAGKRPHVQVPFMFWALAIALLTGLSSLWALDSDFAVERSTKIAAVLLGGGLLFTALQTRQIVKPQIFYRGFLGAYFVGAVLYLIDIYFDGPIYGLTHTWDEDALNISWLNRSVVVLALLSPLVLACINALDTASAKKNALYALLVIIAGLIAYQTHSQSAQIAIIVGAVFYAAFPYQYKKAWLAFTGLLCAGFVSAPWLVQWLYNALAAKLKTLPWFSNAYAADRLEIWDFVARKALENPLYGFGVEATRHIEKFETQKLFTPHDHVLHPHNMVMQIWIEFGALGIAVLCAFCAYMLHKMSMLPKPQARLALPLFMMCMFVGCTAYGLWQGWWLGLFTLMFAVFAIVRGDLAVSQEKTA